MWKKDGEAPVPPPRLVSSEVMAISARTLTVYSLSVIWAAESLRCVCDCIFKQSDKGYITKEALRRKVFKRNIPLVGLYSPLSLIQFPQNASLVTADSRAPLINAAKRKCLSLSGRV